MSVDHLGSEYNSFFWTLQIIHSLLCTQCRHIYHTTILFQPVTSKLTRHPEVQINIKTGQPIHRFWGIGVSDSGSSTVWHLRKDPALYPHLTWPHTLLYNPLPVTISPRLSGWPTYTVVATVITNELHTQILETMTDDVHSHQKVWGHFPSKQYNILDESFCYFAVTPTLLHPYVTQNCSNNRI